MDDQNFKDLALRARNLYRLMANMQNTMLEIFFDEFCDLDEREQKQMMLSEEQPF